ncbi:MAG: type IV pili twitching motility protein PilT [Planctomycetes bacterium]|jgi:twitching motility protein PilT|nr:type IV pili twitching motility protein PilT [Planctomycetota bacterium]MDP6408623.1 type IV pilus twitching motility protein PilT [Planctomycetota bacterium]
MITMEELLALMVRQGGSDLHLSVASPPRIRVDGLLLPVETAPLNADDTRRLATSILDSDQIAKLDRDLELDCSFGLEGHGRFRANVFHQQGAVAAVMRSIPSEIPAFEDLGMPAGVCERICSLRSGLVLVTGATGSGKSTSLAAMIDYVNTNRQAHIVTIEDPVEFTHQHKGCVVTQREIGGDTRDFRAALRSVLRQDPDIVLVGELRDHETIEAALTLAETGHLTFATLHTSDAVQTVNRIVDVFPAHQQSQVRTQLSFTLEGVFSQQLMPSAGGRGRVLTAEIMLATPGIRALIRDGKSHQLYSQIQTGGRLGMTTMAQSMASKVREGAIDLLDAEMALSDASELMNLIKAA